MTASVHGAIENARREAIAAACKIMPEHDSIEAAGDAAAREFDHLLATRAAIREAKREQPARRLPFMRR